MQSALLAGWQRWAVAVVALTNQETETLWEAARRQGKRVGIVLYPGADGKSERRRGSFGVIWPERPLQKSAFLSLGPEGWAETSESVADGAVTFSLAREAQLMVETSGKGAMRLRLVALGHDG